MGDIEWLRPLRCTAKTNALGLAGPLMGDFGKIALAAMRGKRFMVLLVRTDGHAVDGYNLMMARAVESNLLVRRIQPDDGFDGYNLLVRLSE